MKDCLCPFIGQTSQRQLCANELICSVYYPWICSYWAGDCVNPFGEDVNGLPLEGFGDRIRQNVDISYTLHFQRERVL
jgi:hypothetical protein